MDSKYKKWEALEKECAAEEQAELEAASDDVGKAQNEVELGKVDHNEGKLRRPPRANSQLGGHLAGGKL